MLPVSEEDPGQRQPSLGRFPTMVINPPSPEFLDVLVFLEISTDSAIAYLLCL
jgi:hypothetical protein